MRRIAILCAVLSAACGAERPATAPPPASLEGAWPLLTVNGEKLPSAWDRVAPYTHRRVRLDSLILTEDGAVRRWTVVQDSTNNSETVPTWSTGWERIGVSLSILTDSGTYSRDGQAVSIRFNRDDAPLTGRVDGTGLSLNVGGFTYRYARPK